MRGVRGRRWTALLGALLAGGAACGEDPDAVWTDPRWDVAASVDGTDLLISATIGNVHDDFIHVSIRKDGWDNGYTIERSPAPDQPDRDWSRPHRWFGDFYPDTWLEGRFEDGRNDGGPSSFASFTYRVPLAPGTRSNYPDEDGGEYDYLTRGYNYADGQSRHPGFPAGDYEIEIYAWYTGRQSVGHPAIGGQSGVQYIHFERQIATTRFTVD